MNECGKKWGNLYIRSLGVLKFQFFVCGKGLNDHQWALRKGRGKLRVEVILVILCLSVCLSVCLCVPLLQK